ncbi:hypothetical protein BaRGS_00028383 [Batillaria attramentaria]|uniref:Uncharacterized protein n=1 Tax=Batillaria attramentaria TaxID=370345 RepID=A0ABD0JZ29_9CAEN
MGDLKDAGSVSEGTVYTEPRPSEQLPTTQEAELSRRQLTTLATSVSFAHVRHKPPYKTARPSAHRVIARKGQADDNKLTCACPPLRALPRRWSTANGLARPVQCNQWKNMPPLPVLAICGPFYGLGKEISWARKMTFRTVNLASIESVRAAALRQCSAGSLKFCESRRMRRKTARTSTQTALARYIVYKYKC